MMRGLAGGMGGGGRRGWTVRSGMDRLLSGSGGCSTGRRCTGSGVRRSCIERRYSLYPASASRTSVSDLLYCCCSMMSRCCANDACSASSRSLSASSSSCNTQQHSHMLLRLCKQLSVQLLLILVFDFNYFIITITKSIKDKKM